MAERPAGTVTLLFTDVEGSTRLLQTYEQAYPAILAGQRAILREAARRHGGYEVDARGEEVFVAFPRAKDALAAALTAQRALQHHQWPEGAAVRVRMGLHTGEPVITDSGYVGMDVHRASRICNAGYGGQILLSEATRSLIGGDLPPGVSVLDLGEHRLKDLIHPTRLYQVVSRDLPSEFPPLRSLATLPNNLPVQLTSFVGREREMTGIKAQLAGARLLTLTGSGGCGKTRLAVHVAADVLDDFPDGVWLVELATLADARLIPQTIAGALGIREQSARPLLQTVTEYLQPRTILLVLDNCEHLVPDCAALIETILRACPRVRILATSREPVGATGETIWPVPPLSVPEARQPVDPALLPQAESVRLFIERVEGVVPSFSLGPHNAAAVAQICRRLDGIPLAIELAAARVKVLSVDELAARLDDRFRLLTGGSRTAMPRHQTLRATMDWSHDLLSPEERMLFRRLAVFAGGFTLPAAEAVCAGDGVEPSTVLDVLTRLVDRSLVMVDLRGEVTRYRLLETVRQYALEKLLAAGEAPGVRAGHRDWYLHRAEQAEDELHGAGQRVWFDLLEAEHDNLRAAMEWSGAEPSGAERTLRLAGSLWWFWFVRGYLTEGRERIEKALANDDVRSSVRARALVGTGGLASLQGDYEPAVRFAEEGVAIYRELGGDRDLAVGLTILGYVTARRGNYEAARAMCADAVALARESGYLWGLAFALYIQGDVALISGDYRRAQASLRESLAHNQRQGDGWITRFAQLSLAMVARQEGEFAFAEELCSSSLAQFQELNDKWGMATALRTSALVHHAAGRHDEAADEFQESLELYQKLGDRSGVAFVARGLALVAHRKGDLDRAATLCAESLSLFRELGDRRGMADALQTAGLIARAKGDFARAAGAWQESLDLFWQAGDRWGTAQCLRLLAEIAVALGELPRAARLFGALEGVATTLEVDPTLHGRADYERSVGEVRAKMGPDEFARATHTGRSMTAEQAVTFAKASPPASRNHDSGMRERKGDGR
ncbi:MAG TPA: tetratricopeptide repeat protein [bacterium]|nr:tetratricopeptide repeat protein [bacterium]